MTPSTVLCYFSPYFLLHDRMYLASEDRRPVSAKQAHSGYATDSSLRLSAPTYSSNTTGERSMRDMVVLI